MRSKSELQRGTPSHPLGRKPESERWQGSGQTGTLTDHWWEPRAAGPLRKTMWRPLGKLSLEFQDPGNLTLRDETRENRTQVFKQNLAQTHSGRSSFAIAEKVETNPDGRQPENG